VPRQHRTPASTATGPRRSGRFGELSDGCGDGVLGDLGVAEQQRSGGGGTGLTLLGGLVLTAAGTAALALGAVALVVLPALWILSQPTTSRRRS
jgi:hypothetical protein